MANWFSRMFTPSKADSQSGEQYNAAYNYAQDQWNTPHFFDVLSSDKRAVFNQMRTALDKSFANPLSSSALNAMKQSQDLTDWYAGQRASYTPGYINPEIDAAERLNLNNQFYGAYGTPGAKALAEEQFAGTGGYWGDARANAVMNTYGNTVTNPYSNWRANALQNSYGNAAQYAANAGTMVNNNIRNQLSGREAEDKNFQNALAFMGLEDQVLNAAYTNPDTYARSQRMTPGTNGAGRMVGGGAGAILGATFGGPAGGYLGYQLGSGIGGGFDKEPQQYTEYGTQPIGTPERGSYNWQPAVDAYSDALGYNGGNASKADAIDGGNYASWQDMLKQANLQQGNSKFWRY